MYEDTRQNLKVIDAFREILLHRGVVTGYNATPVNTQHSIMNMTDKESTHMTGNKG